jgi:hypothetical protein
MILTAIFTGLQASELRGLKWPDVDLKTAELHVRQRADRYGTIGSPKSKSGQRTVPLPPMLVNVLREWKLACPKNDLDLVFPTSTGERRDGSAVGGGIEHHTNIVHRGFIPAQISAGVVVPVLDENGKPVIDKDGKPTVRAKYTAPAFLCLMVHRPPEGRWPGWPRAAAQGGAVSARALVDHDDDGHIRTPVPARRRGGQDGEGGEGASGLS